VAPRELWQFPTMSTTTAEKKTPKAKLSRKTKKKIGRDKRKAKLKDPVAKKAYFEAKSKRSAESKSAFRKKKRGKK
jgi:hypothetical protein